MVKILDINDIKQVTGEDEQAVMSQKAVTELLRKLASNKVIVNFGDSIFGMSRPPYDVSTELARLTGATVHNCAFGGCRMSQHSGHYGAFAMCRLADAIVTGDWSLQEDALNYDDRPTYADVPLALLKSLDFTKVDIITIAYGTNDWGSATGKLDNPDDTYDVTYFGGALRYSIKRLLEAFPNLQIFILGPTYRCWLTSTGTFEEDTETKVIAGHLLTDYVELARNIAKEHLLPFIDNYYELGINKHNRAHYFTTTDGTHHVAAGRKLIAAHIAKELF